MKPTYDRPQGGIKKINCPTCQTIVTWNQESPFRPFCSRQCQLIDFGDWAQERFRLPLEERDDLSFKPEEEDGGESGN